MTDNEKAATFIGWTGAPCDANFNCPRWETSDGISAPLGRIHIDHPTPAPDMTDPRNYMKALLGLQDKYLYLHINGDEWGMSNDWEDGWIRAESPVELLAALYDAEHHKGEGR